VCELMRKATAPEVLAGSIATATTALHFFRQLGRRRNVSNGREWGGRGDLLAATQCFVEFLGRLGRIVPEAEIIIGAEEQIDAHAASGGPKAKLIAVHNGIYHAK
jgi:hypothetical protein